MGGNNTEEEEFKDSDGKIYKVSAEEKEYFLSLHPDAVPTSESEFAPTNLTALLNSGISADETGNVNIDEKDIEALNNQLVIENYNQRLEQEEIDDMEDLEIEDVDQYEEFENFKANKEIDEIIEKGGDVESYLASGGSDFYDEDYENSLKDEYVELKETDAYSELSKQGVGPEAIEALKDGLINPNASLEELLNFNSNTKLGYDIWTQASDNGESGDYTNDVLNLYPFTKHHGGQDRAEVELKRDKWTVREGNRHYTNDIQQIANQLEIEYINDGYTITKDDKPLLGPIKSISRKELEKLAKNELKKDQTNHIEKYASKPMIRAHKLQKEYLEILNKYGPESSIAKEKLKEYNAIREDMASGALPMFDETFENYLKKRPELKEQMNSEAEEIAKTTNRQSIENEMMALYYEQIYMNKVMVEGGGIDRINEGIGVWRKYAGLPREEGIRQEQYLQSQGYRRDAIVSVNLREDLVTGNKIDLPTQFDIERMMANDKDGVAGNRLPYPTTVLPENNAFTEYYNKKMLRYQTLAKALYGNYDPSTLPQTGFIDHFAYGVLNLMGTSEGDPLRQSADKIAKEYVEGIQYLRGEDAVTPEELERAEDRTRDLISAGTPEFMALMGIMASVKAPAAGMLGRLSTLGGRLVGYG